MALVSQSAEWSHPKVPASNGRAGSGFSSSPVPFCSLITPGRAPCPLHAPRQGTRALGERACRSPGLPLLTFCLWLCVPAALTPASHGSCTCPSCMAGAFLLAAWPPGADSSFLLRLLTQPHFFWDALPDHSQLVRALPPSCMHPIFSSDRPSPHLRCVCLSSPLAVTDSLREYSNGQAPVVAQNTMCFSSTASVTTEMM